jgi:spermidine/putrescine transport system permease protein
VRRGGRLLAGLSLLTYAFLYAPLLVLALFSLNRGRLGTGWEGLSLVWYEKLAGNAAILQALRVSLTVALTVTLLTTALGTAAALALHRHRFRGTTSIGGLLVLPMVVPEVVVGSSLLLLFAAIGLSLGWWTVVLAHVGFCVSYVVLVVRARLQSFDRTLEDAAADLGAGPWSTLRHVTLPLIAPAVAAGALLVFALSIDDYVVTSFVAGVGATTLPLQIYSMVRTGMSPEINAICTLLLVATGGLLFAAQRLEHGAGGRRAALPAVAGVLLLAAPFVLGGGGGKDRVLNVYIWSNYIAPETVKRFEDRYGVRVNLDTYDTNEALLAKVAAGNVEYDVLCPSNYPIEVLIQEGRLRALDRDKLPHLSNLDPRFRGLRHDPEDRYSLPYFWGTTGIGFRRSRTGPVDSWAALWDPRFKGRILMLDDPREAFGAALKRLGLSLNTTDDDGLRRAQRLLFEQKPLVLTYNASNFEDVLLAGDVWLAQGWNGQLARAIDQDPDIEYVVPKEGSAFFLDSLVIPVTAPHPDLAHAFLDFTLEAKTAAEICRTMRYSTPNRAAVPLLPDELKRNAAVFPPADVLARVELIDDVGEATVTYERFWTEVKTRGD